MRRGFRHISLSDLLREEVQRRHQQPSIELLRAVERSSALSRDAHDLVAKSDHRLIVPVHVDQVGNELREAKGHGVLGKMACARMAREHTDPSQIENWVITSIRHPAEVGELRRGCGGPFCLVFVDAPARMRFDR